MKVLDLYNNEDHDILRSEGWSTTMIAQALRLHETSIVRHIDDYVSKNKLAPANGGA